MNRIILPMLWTVRASMGDSKSVRPVHGNVVIKWNLRRGTSEQSSLKLILLAPPHLSKNKKTPIMTCFNGRVSNRLVSAYIEFPLAVRSRRCASKPS